MPTLCIQNVLTLAPCGRRRVEAAFDGGLSTSDAGVVLLREAARRRSFFARVATCFSDFRSQPHVEHTLEELLAQRSLGIACGYEDLNDHTTLRYDPALALATGKAEPMGTNRRQERNRGRALAGSATLNRIELAPEALDPKRRDLKNLHDPWAIEDLLVELFLDAYDEAPAELVLDLDATDDLIHGHQEGVFYHGYYRGYCDLPLDIFCGEHLLVAKLRTAVQDGAGGSLEEVERVVGRIRERWPDVKVTLRADSGFCRDWLMSWCEGNAVDYIFGLARNSRLAGMIASEMAERVSQVEETEEEARTFKELRYRTLNSWSKERRVVAKVAAIPGKPNPRFVVTTFDQEAWVAKTLYEDLYCARGDRENRIKEQQLDLFADRTSSRTMRSNQLRVWFSALAYILMNDLRRVGLAGTDLARDQVATIRNRLLKIGARLTQSVRRVRISMSEAFPLQQVFTEVLTKLQTPASRVF